MKFLRFFVLFVLKEASGVIYRLNETEYNKLPPLYELDEFYPCLQAPRDIYCYVDALLVANATSDLLNIIKEYSADTITHFNRTVVHRGLCVAHTCRQHLTNSTNLNGVLEACLNATLYESYQLQVNLIQDKVECTHFNEKAEIDAGDYAVAIVMALLLVMVVGGSVWDCNISESRHISFPTSFSVFSFGGSEALATQLSDSTRNDQRKLYVPLFVGARILLCFSLKRNWQRLTQPSGEGPEPRLERLKSFNGIKTITTMLVILGHSPVSAIFNTNNPEFAEQTYHNPMYYLVYGGSLIVQTFFIISGFLLAYNILLAEEKTRIDWKMLPKGVILRWLRLTPPYAAMLALICTWLRHIGNGPFWKTNVGLEIANCRSDWYYHLLYVHNFVDNSQCMAHTWYLAADMQLSVLGLLLFCLATGARARKMAVGAAIILGLLTPAVHTYVQDLYPILMMTPEVALHFFVEDPTFNKLHKRGHTNLVCYALGLGLGIVVYSQQEKIVDVAKYKKYRPLYWAAFPLSLLLMMTAGVFYIDGIQIPLAIRVVYSSAVKAMFGLLLIPILLGTIFKIENFYRPVMEWRGWAAPGRISYCAFLVHVTIIRIILAINYLGLLTSSFLLAVPLWMIVEAPCTQLVKVCLMPNLRRTNLETNKSVSLATQIVVLGSKETIDVKL